MSRVRSALAVLAVGAAVAGCGGSGPSSTNSVGTAATASGSPTAVTSSPASSSATPSAAPSSPPRVTEQFTVLPCRHGTTIGLEGCAEHATLRADSTIDTTVAKLWSGMDAVGRAKLAAAQQAWLAYRTAACASMADAFRGGTQAGVVAAQCMADLSRQRAEELTRQSHLVAQRVSG